MDLRVALIAGNPRRRSRTLAATEEIARLLRTRRVQTQVHDLACEPLPLLTGSENEQEGGPNPSVHALIVSVESAAALVLATPLYNGSYAAPLKNAVDYLPRGILKGKPVALVAQGAGEHGVGQACGHLADVVNSLGGLVIPTYLCAVASDFDIDSEGRYRVRSPELQRRMHYMVDQLVDLAVRLA